MTNLLIREWLNGALIPLNICIMIVISKSLWDSRRKFGRGWTRVPGVSSACAFWWIFLADLIRSCMAWHLLHAQNLGQPLNYLTPTTTTAYIAAALMATLATFRLIYTLGPASWGHRGWVVAAVLTVIIVAVLGAL